MNGKFIPGTRLGADISVARKDGLVLENSTIFTLSGIDKYTIGLAMGLYTAQDQNDIGGMNLIVETISDKKSNDGKACFKFFPDVKTNTATIQLVNWDRTTLSANSHKVYTMKRKISEFSNADVIVELIVWPTMDRKDTLVVNLNLYTKTI